ncbi:MAG: tRNA pseudouridine(55) synthase TruB [Dehalococcoidia bacterium]|nr:tRNA pseudouridine(55) synthase TruB [Dehalococcoidia bacterium]
MSARRTDSGLDGIVLIDKPAGWTSHDVVAKARGILGQRRIGHTGTLDPMATGLLVLCLGKAARLVEYMTAHDKRYTGQIRLGRTTTTDDADGETIEDRPVPALTPAALEAAVAPFRGSISQLPPAFSALKVGGQRAYDLARRGEQPELHARTVTVSQFSAALAGPETLEIDVACSAGTYIRSLARDLGQALGCGAHLSALRRVRAGAFSVSEAVTLDGLHAAVAAGDLEPVLLPVDEGISALDAAILVEDSAGVLANGGVRTARGGATRSSEVTRIYDAAGGFLGVASVSSLGEIRPRKVFPREKS